MVAAQTQGAGESNGARKKRKKESQGSDHSRFGHGSARETTVAVLLPDLTTGNIEYDITAYERKEVSHISTSADGRYFYSVSKGKEGHESVLM